MGWLSQILTGHGGHGGGHGGHGEGAASNATPSAPEAAIDPVSGEAVRTAQALTSLYQGKIYYFTSSENRERFEAAPLQYVQNAAGHPMAAPQPPQPQQHGSRGRRGC